MRRWVIPLLAGFAFLSLLGRYLVDEPPGLLEVLVIGAICLCTAVRAAGEDTEALASGVEN